MVKRLKSREIAGYDTGNVCGIQMAWHRKHFSIRQRKISCIRATLLKNSSNAHTGLDASFLCTWAAVMHHTHSI
eukprot:scaffold37996_cov191-Amphora_coffeaeformis.AAC.5